jgi:hypothetical protein
MDCHTAKRRFAMTAWGWGSLSCRENGGLHPPYDYLS